jgi:steroid delta-isomerase-like uncharacterized protein
MRTLFQVLPCLLVLACAMGCEDPARRNKEVIQRNHEEIWSKGNLDLIDELYTEDFVCHFLVGEEWRGRQDLIEKVSSHRTAFPDWREEVIRLVAEGDFVVAHFASSGTNEGEFEGHPPTGKQARIHEIAIFRLENGKIAEQWGFPDVQGLSHQLGIDGPPTNQPTY